jgi:site-specific recombinase XerD
MGDSLNERIFLEYMFPDGPQPAAVSERLQRWVQAFAHWLADLGARFTPGTTRQAKLSWKRLYVQLQLDHPPTPRMPWELEASDITAHSRWLGAQGYAASTIANSIGYLAGFYRWCAARRIRKSA